MKNHKLVFLLLSLLIWGVILFFVSKIEPRQYANLEDNTKAILGVIIKPPPPPPPPPPPKPEIKPKPEPKKEEVKKPEPPKPVEEKPKTVDKPQNEKPREKSIVDRQTKALNTDTSKDDVARHTAQSVTNNKGATNQDNHSQADNGTKDGTGDKGDGTKLADQNKDVAKCPNPNRPLRVTKNISTDSVSDIDEPSTTVHIVVNVDANGKVTSASTSSPSSVFNNIMKKRAMSMRFEPKLVNCNPVAETFTFNAKIETED